MNSIANELIHTPARILAVDDQPVCLATLQALLVTANYQVETANNGFDALSKLKRFAPDLVVSDLRMPEMSGFELLAVIRKRFPHITTVAVSGEVSVTEIGGLLADLFLEKGSYSPWQLLAVIHDLLDRSPLRPRLPAAERTLACLPRTMTGNYGLTCSECLRFFMFASGNTETGKPRYVSCPHCKETLPYFVDPITARPENIMIYQAA